MKDRYKEGSAHWMRLATTRIEFFLLRTELGIRAATTTISVVDLLSPVTLICTHHRLRQLTWRDHGGLSNLKISVRCQSAIP